MDWELRGCKVCEAPKKHLTCPQCFHNTVTFDKTWRKLAAARRLRAELEEQITAALQSRVSCRFDSSVWLCKLLPILVPELRFQAGSIPATAARATELARTYFTSQVAGQALTGGNRYK